MGLAMECSWIWSWILGIRRLGESSDMEELGALPLGTFFDKSGQTTEIITSRNLVMECRYNATAKKPTPKILLRPKLRH